ncbi:uncharacterized protein TM35_000162500 [Trypanosoma theileri]|uniref:Uncharacterized protein n=1 Tax=Trypanosoma theileri TaxID=67003 RepID=A0A1X0NVB1_9TRYP|nr:uncharacterized protein TM35_000162500 [Trypanosoma theileri]ORC88612.1 hypothetical protein TM35_000162500 [Trypanosoma theileri]
MDGPESDADSWREHYLDLFADGETRGERGKQSCFVTRVEMFERLQDDPSLNEIINEIHIYTEPLASWGPLTFLAGDHYFAVIETQNWWWSIELRDDMIVIQRGKDFTNVQSRCQGRYRRYRLLHNGPSLVCNSSCGQRYVRDLVLAIYNKGYFSGDLISPSSHSHALVNFIWLFCRSH